VAWRIPDDRKMRHAVVLFALTTVCLLSCGVWLLTAGRNPFRDPRLAESQFRALVEPISSTTKHVDVRAAALGLDEIRFVDSERTSSVWLSPHPLRWGGRGGGDMFAHIHYTPEGFAVLVESGYATSTDQPIPGIPKRRCLLDEAACDAALRRLAARR
jgi:hypothetical protein